MLNELLGMDIQQVLDRKLSREKNNNNSKI